MNKDSDQYKEIYNKLDHIENSKVRNMQASKQYYKTYPDIQKPQKRVKKQVDNVDSISYLKSKFSHEQIINMLEKEQ